MLSTDTTCIPTTPGTPLMLPETMSARSLGLFALTLSSSVEQNESDYRLTPHESIDGHREPAYDPHLAEPAYPVSDGPLCHVEFFCNVNIRHRAVFLQHLDESQIKRVKAGLHLA
jgi:hypothetical protein